MCPFFVLVTLGVSVFNLECYMVLGEDPSSVLPSSSTGLCLNCTVCEHPCHPLPPPSPLAGYSSYGAPPSPPSFPGYPSYGAPPPPPPPSLSTYPSYGAPPPPPSHPVQANCPPAPVQCCQYPTNPNPNEYYHPVDENHSPTTPYSPVSSFSVSVVIILLLPFAGLFF